MKKPKEIPHTTVRIGEEKKKELQKILIDENSNFTKFINDCIDKKIAESKVKND